MAGVVGRLARTGLRKGLREGSRPWLYVGLAATAVRLGRRLLAERPETVYVTTLRPGETLEIRERPADS
ncbi:MAG: hypothetical protein M5U14_05870 [Acidimicrobiia bacterium]|nr:hypothetical protein [Acidimicrobiia bacterium]